VKERRETIEEEINSARGEMKKARPGVNLSAQSATPASGGKRNGGGGHEEKQGGEFDCLGTPRKEEENYTNGTKHFGRGSKTLFTALQKHGPHGRAE